MQLHRLLPLVLGVVHHAAAGPKQPKGHWTNLAPIPAIMQEHSAAALGHEIYVMGGLPPAAGDPDSGPPPPGPMNHSVKDVRAYNIRTNTWRAVAPLPIGMTHINAAAVNGKLYVLGGLGDVPHEDVIWKGFPDSFVYDPAVNTWSPVPAMPEGHARGACAVAVAGDVVYLAGGMTYLEVFDDGRVPLELSVDTVSAFNVTSQTWRALPSLPGRRDHIAGAVVNDRFVVFGGRDQHHWNITGDTYVMSTIHPDKGWVTKAPMITPRGGHSAGAIGNWIVSFGGEANTEVQSGVFNVTEAYNIKTDRWISLGEMPLPRHGTVAAAVDGRVYVPGGGVRISGAPSSHFDAFSFSCGK